MTTKNKFDAMRIFNLTKRFCDACQTETDRNSRGKCKKCEVKRVAAWVIKNPEKARSGKAAWYIANRELSDARSAAWFAANPEIKKESNKKWIRLNPEKSKANSSAWRAAHREEMRIHEQNRRAKKKAGGTLSKNIAAKLFKLQKGKCPCCGFPLGDDFHLDHIFPIALGGVNKDENIQLLRSTCNHQKHAKHPIDYMQSRGFLL